MLDALKNKLEKTTKELNTIEMFVDQIQTDGIKSTCKLPAVLIHFRRLRAKIDSEGTEVDLLIITENKAFNKNSNLTNIIDLTLKIINGLTQSPGFTYKEKDYLINLQNQNITGEPLLQTQRHSMYVVKLKVTPL